MEHQVDSRLRAALAALPSGGGRGRRTPCGDDDLLLQLFDSAAESRHLDLIARELRASGSAYYTIGSAGHEANAAVAAAVRPSDPALLHYRSGAFYLQRARQVSGHGPIRGIRDVLLGLLGAAAEPIAGGRHKVFGHGDLGVIPQTSTIASHLPRAVGLAFGLERAAKLGVDSEWPADAIVVASFGDASVNHSTATGALNTAGHVVAQGLALPVLFVCEDNGLGVSVRTPPGWVAAAYGDRAGLRYLAADGADPRASLAVARSAADYVRTRRRPAFLHLSCVRFMGHAGSDAEIAYRTPAELDADYGRDPILGAARALLDAGVLDGAGIGARYAAARDRVRSAADELAGSPQPAGTAAIMAPIAPRDPGRVAAAAARCATDDVRARRFGGRLPETEGPLTLAQALNRALTDAAATRPEVLIFGEDVARKGGVYGVTLGLRKRFGAGRVFDTLLDEQSILGLALGTGLAGLLPVPEIQYLAYLHNAADQIRGEAATLQFFSQGRYRNPMLVRVAGLAYQKGFGGHFHNDNAVAALRDIPGVVLACPSRPDDAAAMLRTCLAAGEVDGSVCLFLEPIALYHTRDLHEPGDDGWLTPYPPPRDWAGAHVPIGAARCHGSGTDATLVTFGNGVPMSLRVAKTLTGQDIDVRVLDMRWLAPLPVDDILAAALATGRVLVVDETRRSGGVSEGVVTALVDAGFDGRIARVTSEDSFVPLGDAASHVLLAERTIEDGVRRLLD